MNKPSLKHCHLVAYFSEPVLFSVSERGWCSHLVEGVRRISGIGKAPSKVAEYSTANKTIIMNGKSAYGSATIRVPTLRFSVSTLKSCLRNMENMPRCDVLGCLESARQCVLRRPVDNSEALGNLWTTLASFSSQASGNLPRGHTTSKTLQVTTEGTWNLDQCNK